jgi:hypothetical protein
MTATMTLTNEFSGRMTGSSLFPFPWEEGWTGLEDRHREGVPRDTCAPWPVSIPPVGREKSTCQSINVFPSRWETGFIPRTDLGRRLYALRTKAVNAGMKLLSEEEVLEEVKKRRGEIEENEKDLY